MTIFQNPVILISQEYKRSARTQDIIAEFLEKLFNFFSTVNSSASSSLTVSITDLQEIKLSLQGDSGAYKRIIERYQQHVSQILWKFTRDERIHEELVQDVFVEAYLSLRTYKAKAPLAHWLAKVASRVGFHHWKQN